MALVSAEIHKEIYSRCNPAKGDILYIKDGATTGVVTINDLEEPFSMLSSVALLKLPSCIFNRLIVEFLRSPFFYDQMRGFMKGAAITRVTLKRIAPALVPLPPLAEQHRIVAKVDELMALCDQLEAAKTQREQSRERLVAASLQRLNQPADDEEAFREDARFTFNHLPRLTTRPAHIKQLRQTILNLAVRGKLVEQDPSDEPASELIKRIQAEKARLVKDGKLKKSAITLSSGNIEGPLELPATWALVCLGDVAQYGIPEKVNSNREIEPKTWVLDLEDVEKDTSRLIDRAVSEDRPFLSTKTAFKRGDVLFGKLRPYLNKVVVADMDGVCSTEIVPIRGYCGIVPDYTKLVLKSPLIMRRVDQLMYGMKMPRLGTNDAILLEFPLPPLPEQHRIVAKVDELMALCDQLEAQLTLIA
jgi:type I restriction enzyme S subunit